LRSGSIGTPAASRSKVGDDDGRQAGFTLLEALVALALILAFAAAIGPFLFQARRIIADAEGRLAAQALLRSLIDAPFDRSRLANAVRNGETAGLRWRIVTEPMPMPAAPSHEPPKWAPFRVIVSVSSDAGHVIAAETMRLANVE
jgi:prepilin-type N-terminal cleavage/methylation domain-containing protein